MKLRSLLCGLLAVAAISACKQEEPVVTPSLDVNKTSAAVPAEGGEVTVEVTSNVEWTAKADQNWVAVSPAGGEGTGKAEAVKLTVEPNETEATRTATVTVSAEKLTKTVKITQAGMEAPEPVTYILVGEAVGGWDPAANGVVLTLSDGYYCAKAVSVTAKKGMHFTKNAAWEGNVKGKHGLIAPNEIGEVGSNDISLTEGGKFDVYLTEALDKFYFMSEGKLPSEAVEHKDIAVSWGICGDYGNSNWGSGDPDVELVQDGEWYVAKNIEFTEVNFKVRGNNSWADDVKWGRAAEDQICELNKAIAVSTCTEYKAANEGAGDNPNVYIDAPAGTYDVYFSPDKKEVWVMTPGYKPGEAPAPAEYEVDGKQWVFAWQAMGGASCVIDLGVTQPGMAILAYDMGILDPSYSGIYYPYMMGEYSVAKTDGTSGVVTISADGRTVEVPYSAATATTVHFESADLLEGENIDCTLASELIVIALDAAQGLADGEYWIIADNKVATPLVDKAYGYLPVVDAVDGRSTAANAFTFTQVDAGLYTIQDSNGKYYYQTGTYNSFNVADEDGMTDEFLWEVYDSGNGQYVILNYEVGKFVQYSTEYNSYGSYPDERGVMPYLVLAENPVEEPSEPVEITEETVIWEGSHNTATWSGNQDLAWGGYDWAGIKAGCKLRLYVTPNNPSSDWWCISLRSAADGWPNLTGIPAQYDKPSYSVTLDLTQALLDEIKTGNGLIFTGSETTVTKVSLLPADAEVAIWEGSMTSNGYSNCTIGTVNDWINNGAAPGDKVRVYVTGGENWALQISDPQWQKWFATGSDGSQEGLYGHGFSVHNASLDNGYLEFEVTAEMAATIAGYSWGNALIIQGDQIEITKISLN